LGHFTQQDVLQLVGLLLTAVVGIMHMRLHSTVRAALNKKSLQAVKPKVDPPATLPITAKVTRAATPSGAAAAKKGKR
jgi:hypothetical protein